MLHPVKQNVRNPVIPHRHSFSGRLEIHRPVLYLMGFLSVFRGWHQKCSYLPQRKTPGNIQPGAQMEGMR